MGFCFEEKQRIMQRKYQQEENYGKLWRERNIKKKKMRKWLNGDGMLNGAD